MKLRQLPKDFQVEEIRINKLVQKGKYKLYQLEKKELETFMIVSYIAKVNNIPRKEIGIAGLKDKYGITKQFMSIPAEYKLKVIKERNFTLTEIGFLDKPIKIGDLVGNKFIITIRDIKKSDFTGLDQKIEQIKKEGVPNYFDTQRFRSVIRGKFIAKEVIKKNYEEAVKLFLTSYTKHDKSQVKKEKKEILNQWNNLRNVKVTQKGLANIIQVYKQTNNWLTTYKAIPRELKEIFNSAYQSYLWNECINEIIKSTIPKTEIFEVEYPLGNLVFYKKLKEVELPKNFQTIGPKMIVKEYEKSIVENLLKKEQITLKDLDIKEEVGHYFGIHERLVTVIPKELKITEQKEDELNKGRYKLTLEFSLSRGSYATMILKGIFRK